MFMIINYFLMNISYVSLNIFVHLLNLNKFYFKRKKNIINEKKKNNRKIKIIFYLKEG